MRTLILTLLASLTLGFTALAAEPGVKDNAGLFKPETVEKANTEIQQIHKDFGKELVIETYPTIPESLKSDFEAVKDDPQKRAEFFSKWLGDRAHELQVNGVYVLIVKDPGHLEVKAGLKTKAKAFIETNQNKMRDILLEEFKAERYDEGLQKAVDYFRQALKENLGGVHHTGASVAADEHFHHPQSGYSSGSPFPTPYRPPVSTPRNNFFSGSCMWIVLVIIAAIVIIRILSGLGSGPRNYGGPGYGPGPGPGYGGGGPGYGPGYGGGYGGGGGGFFRNVLGGMLGGAAGGYLYDRFRDRNEGAYVPPQNQGGVMPDNSSGGDFGSSTPDDNDRGQGFGGGGSAGDFGPSDSGSSGGDFGGGGGGGGGDFGGGGGDSGGGGGDSGSSGGDF